MPVIQGNYYRDILDQPTALSATLKALVPSPSLLDLAAGLRQGRFQRVVLTKQSSVCTAAFMFECMVNENNMPKQYCPVEGSFGALKWP